MSEQNNSELLGFDLPQSSNNSIIKVIGVGGGGSNAVNHMYHQGIKGVEFMVCNTDNQALALSPVPHRLQLGRNLTEGRGAGSMPEVGRQAALESIEDIRQYFSDGTKMVFITAGMGGGTGTGAAPVIAKLAREMGILTVGIVTVPFSFEGKKRKEHAENGIQNLKEYVDTMLLISNDRLREMYGNLSLRHAFGKADDILTTAAKGIAEIITVPGYINVDFEDVKTVMTNGGSAIMGAAISEGENRALRAAQEVLNSPLLNDSDIRGAKHVLIYISYGTDELQMDEMTEITDFVQEAAGMSANMIWGTGYDETLGNAICVTLIATGFTKEERNSSQSESLVLPVSNKNNAEIALEIHQEKFSSLNHVDLEIENKHEVTLKHEPQFEIIDLGMVNEELPPLNDLEDISSNSNESLVLNLLDDHELEDQDVFPSTTDKGKLDIHAIMQAQQAEEGKKKAISHERPSESKDRRESLQRITQQLRRPSDLSLLEKQPAFVRRNVKLEPHPTSKDQFASNLSITPTQDGFQIRENNSFLHDSVD
jgi:cell division protein FtsZ